MLETAAPKPESCASNVDMRFADVNMARKFSKSSALDPPWPLEAVVSVDGASDCL